MRRRRGGIGIFGFIIIMTILDFLFESGGLILFGLVIPGVVTALAFYGIFKFMRYIFGESETGRSSAYRRSSNVHQKKSTSYVKNSRNAQIDKVLSEYFKDNEELAKGFANDNPLANSASCEIHLNSIEAQSGFVAWLQEVPGVRKVNYSMDTAAGLIRFNKLISAASAVIIGILLAVSVFLISNTISTAAAFRKDENRIMRLIGATNFMIRAPLVVEGILIGLAGAVIPLTICYFMYRQAVQILLEKFNILSSIVDFLPVEAIFPTMAAVALALGVGIGFIGSFFTIRKHLKV